MKAISLLLLFLSVSFQVNAQSATFSNVRLELNVPDNNGRQMIKMHYTMSISGARGHDVNAALYVYRDRNGTRHYYPNGSQMINNGNSFNCNYDETILRGDNWLGIYNDQLNPLPGKHTYYCQLWAYDYTAQKWLGHSDFFTYEMTGAMQAPPIGGYINYPGYSVIGGGGGGGNAGNYQNDSGNSSYQRNSNSNHSSHDKMCSKCVGSGKCNTCHGRGTYMPRVGDPYKTCVACGGSGRCTLCNGSGKYGHSY